MQKQAHASAAHPHPSPLAVAWALGKVTFQEIVRDKILYNIVVFAFLILGLGFLASKLTATRADRVMLDFGMSAVAISCALVGIFIGSAAIGREFDRRTAYVALAHPISRFQFVVAKYLGIVLVLAANWALLCAAFLVIIWKTADAPETILHSSFAWGLILALAQSFLTAALAIVFSTFSTTSLAAILSIGIYLVGSNVSQIRLVVAKTQEPLTVLALNTVAGLVPNYEYFALGTKVTYGIGVGWQYGVTALLYALVYICACLVFSGILVRSKES